MISGGIFYLRNKLSNLSYDILCYVCKSDKAVLRIIFLFQMLHYLDTKLEHKLNA